MRVLGIAFLLSLAACGSDRDAPVQPRPEPLVVYANSADEATLRDQFAEFTRDSGIPVMFRFGDSAANTKLVITNLGSPPADILLTDNVADLWQAAEQGALRPMQADSIEVLPSSLRDPDGLWATLNIRYAAIEVSPMLATTESPDYQSLATAEFKDRVCLSSSSLSINRSLIAMLIQELGVRPAELMVRGWVGNLALPPFATEAKLREALQSGVCSFAIVSQQEAPDGAAFYVDIDGVGVGRHSRYPASAHRFVKWLLEQSVLTEFHATNDLNVGIAGWRDEEATLLAERAGYR